MKITEPAMNHRNIILFLLSLIILIITLWVPIGIKNTPNSGEEWYMVEIVEHNDHLIPDPEWPTRPLRWIPYLLAFNLAPDSLMGFNILLMILFVLRGIATYLLFAQLFPNKFVLVYTTTLFYLVYPIGTGFYDNNTINLQTSLNFGLFAIFTLLLYWRTKKRWLWVIILTLQILCLLTYEIFYIPFGLTPILLWWIDKRFTISRRFIYTVTLWYLFCAIFGIRTLTILAEDKDNHINDIYDRTVEADKAAPLDILSYSVPRLYYKHGITWLRELKLVDIHINFFPYVVLASLSIGTLLWLFHRTHTIPDNRFKYREYFWAIGGSMIFMFGGFLPYMSVLKAFSIDWRIYFIPSLGAAFIGSLGLYWIYTIAPLKASLKKPFYSLTISALLIIGIYHQANQLHQDAKESKLQKQLFANIIELVPDTEATVILVKRDNVYYKDKWFWEATLRMGINYVTERNIIEQPYRALVCNPRPGNRIYCNFKEDKFELYYINWNQYVSYNYSQVIILYINHDGSVELLEDIRHISDYSNDSYEPNGLIKDAALPDRSSTYFDCFPIIECDSEIADNFAIKSFIEDDFDEPVQGLGFPLHFLNREEGTQWMNPDLGVLTYMLEQNQPYILEFAVSAIDESLYDYLQIKVNGTPIEFTQLGQGNARQITGVIPADIIDDGATNIEFNLESAPNSTTANRSLLFDWLTIQPPQSSLRLDFDEVLRGENWSNPSPNGSAWTIGKYSNLFLPLISNQPYTFEFAVTTAQPEILDTLTLQIKDTVLPLQREDRDAITIFSGTIPAELVSDLNLLEIRVTDTFIPAELGIGEDTRELGLAFDWLEIKSKP